MDERNAGASLVRTREDRVRNECSLHGEAGFGNLANVSSGSQQATGGFPVLPSSIINTPTDADFLYLNPNVHDSASLLGNNFGIAAVYDGITTAISEWGTRKARPGFAADHMQDGWNGMGLTQERPKLPPTRRFSTAELAHPDLSWRPALRQWGLSVFYTQGTCR